jgi:hypothetical protein
MHTPKKYLNWLLIPISILFVYILLEMSTYILICFNVIRPDVFCFYKGRLAASDRPYARFDSISGYKYISGSPRLINIIDDSLVNDHHMHVNNRGYSSIYDYSFKKKPGVKRWLIMGDSYSTGEITDSTWVDLIQRKMGTDSVELYNFSLHGAGILGWYNIFFKEILPHYEFDGLILAISGDRALSSFDLARLFLIQHSLPNRTLSFFFDTLPATTQDFYKNYLSRLCYICTVYPSSEIDYYKENMLDAKHKSHFRLMPVHDYFAQYLIDAWTTYYHLSVVPRTKRAEIDMSLPPLPKGDYTGVADYDKMWGAENLKKTRDILGYCLDHDKQVCLISIPSHDVVSVDTFFFHNNLYNRYLRDLSVKYQCSYFDGYSIYDSIPIPQRDNYHLHCDDHWNRAAINIFVQQLYAKKILQQFK